MVSDEMMMAAVSAYVKVDKKCRPAAMRAALEAALSTDAEPVGTPIGFTDSPELSGRNGHGLFAYAGSDISWLSDPIPLYAKCPDTAKDRAEYERREQVCKDAALSQWERSLKRPDMGERDRVIGAIEVFKRQAFAFTMLAAAPAAKPEGIDRSKLRPIFDDAEGRN